MTQSHRCHRKDTWGPGPRPPCPGTHYTGTSSQIPLLPQHRKAMHGSHLPNLVLQEVHIAVQQRVGWREDTHRLHPGTTLQLAFHRHVGKAGQAKEGPLPKIAETDQGCTMAPVKEEDIFLPFFLCNSISAQTAIFRAPNNKVYPYKKSFALPGSG